MISHHRDTESILVLQIVRSRSEKNYALRADMKMRLWFVIKLKIKP